MTDKEAMKQALEALRFGLHVGFDESSESQIKKGGKAFQQHQFAIAALRERLAQPDHSGDATKKVEPEDEPVFWRYALVVEGQEVNEAFTTVNWDTKFEPFGRRGIDHGGDVTKQPLYTRPQQTAHGITGEQK